MSKSFPVLPLLAFLFLTSCGQTAPVPLNTEQDTFSHLFLAQDKAEGGKVMELNLYTIAENTLEESYTVTLPDVRSSGRFESGANDPVQYDPELGLFLFETDGHNMGMGGEECLNADGTCNGRLYQWKVGDENPELFWDSKGSIGGYVLDAATHTLWVSALAEVTDENADGKSAPVAIHLSLLDGSELGRYPLSSLSPLTLTTDGHLFQMTSESAQLDRFGLAELDGRTSALRSFELAVNPALTDGFAQAMLSGLAPDGKHFAYFLDANHPDENPARQEALVVSEVTMDAVGEVLPFEGEVSNFNIYWSADSTHFAVSTRNGVLIYDLATGSPSQVTDQDEAIGLWAPSNRYLLTAKDENIILHDLQLQTSQALPVPFTAWPLGALFY